MCAVNAAKLWPNESRGVTTYDQHQLPDTRNTFNTPVNNSVNSAVNISTPQRCQRSTELLFSNQVHKQLSIITFASCTLQQWREIQFHASRINKLYLYGTINLTKSKVGSYASKTCWFLPCLSVSSHLVWGKRFVCVFCRCGPGYGVMVEGKMYLVKSIITRKWLCWAVPVFVTLSIIYSYKIRTAHTQTFCYTSIHALPDSLHL